MVTGFFIILSKLMKMNPCQNLTISSVTNSEMGTRYDSKIQNVKKLSTIWTKPLE